LNFFNERSVDRTVRQVRESGLVPENSPLLGSVGASPLQIAARNVIPDERECPAMDQVPPQLKNDALRRPS
jgi:hypothetical protein